MNVFEDAKKNLVESSQYLEINNEIIQYLLEPQRFLEVNLNIRMDNGTNKTFKGYRSQHNNACGPYKGGLRYHEDVNQDEIKALSIWMSLKCQVVGIPYGGAKGGICVNPSELSKNELEGLTRAYVASINNYIGPNLDIPAPDVGTNAQVMAWFVDEYNKINGTTELGVVTGKPLNFGGSLGRIVATGFGVVEITKETFNKLNISHFEAEVAVQGFGNVGLNTCLQFYEQGIKVVSVAGHNSNGQFAIYDKNGINIPQLIQFRETEKDMSKFKGVEIIQMEDFWSLKVDAIIPAALENEIDEKIAVLINSKCIVEAANGPVTSNADKLLNEKKIIVIPDILANSCGVVVSYYEWIQNRTQNYWTEEEVLNNASIKMKHSFNNIWNFKEENNIPTLRQSSYAYSLNKIAKTMETRGWI